MSKVLTAFPKIVAKVFIGEIIVKINVIIRMKKSLLKIVYNS